MADFLMPALGADMDEGTLVEWLVKPGDEVHRGDVIAVVDTAKAAIEVESFASGTVEALVVDPGRTVPVGTVLAKIAERPAAGEAAGRPVRERPRERPVRERPVSKRRRAPTRPAAGPGTRPRAEPGARPGPVASPLVRHLAGELGVDLAKVRGTGRAGAVTRADVEREAGAEGPPGAVPAARVPAEAAEAAEVPATEAGRPRTSPLARRLAAELGVDLSAVTGTGPGGVVREQDVRQAARAQQGAGAERAGAERAPAGADEQRRLAGARQATARLMTRSKREIPHYYLTSTVDMTRAMAWLHDRNREREVSDRLVPAALLLWAAAVAARRVPELNGFWSDDAFVPAGAVHLGVAISLRGGGLVTPAIHDAADLPPAELMARLRDLVTRARAGRLRARELTDATITVTNLGDQGVESVHGVIYPPQVALVGFGKVTERPVAVGGLVGARPVVIATLAADHRATDGFTGARYLNALSDLLQRPEET